MLEDIKNQLNKVVKELFDIEVDVEVSIPDEKYGDVASNVAMQLVEDLKKNPREIADEIAKEISKSEGVSGCEVAGPGFINIKLSDAYLSKSILSPSELFLKGKKYLVEYSDPNPFKPLHAGHLYTTVVGDVIARLVENAGAETIRLNYGGDVGLHVAKTLYGISKSDTKKLAEIEDKPIAERMKFIGQSYASGNSAYEEDSKDEIQKINKKVYEFHSEPDKAESADEELRENYELGRKWSYEYFVDFYKQLQVQEFERFIPESENTELGLNTVREQTVKGVYEKSDGAVIFNGEKHGLHKRVFINSEGLPTYETKDVGLSLAKWKDYNFDQSIIITANEQAQYMQVVIKSIEQFAPEPARKTKHLTHGVVKLQGGQKMSSRQGNIVTAMQILQSAREAGQSSQNAQDESIVLAAVKYAFLKHKIGGDIIYDVQESIAMEGNSGPYLQYAHARACSVLKKAGREINDNLKLDSESSLEPGERTLVRKLAEYNHVVSKATRELAPHVICGYIYELAQEFNRFYEENKVIGHEREDRRLDIVSAYRLTLAKGLQVLGITAPEKM